MTPTVLIWRCYIQNCPAFCHLISSLSMLSKVAPQWGISCHPLVHIRNTSSACFDHYIFISTDSHRLNPQTRQTQPTPPPRGLNSTTVLYELFSSTRNRSSQQPTRVLRQPSHELCLAPASTPTQLDPPLDFLKSKSESKSISSYDVNPIYTCPTGLRTNQLAILHRT